MAQGSRYPDMAPNATIDFPFADKFGANVGGAMSGSSKAGPALGQTSNKHLALVIGAIIVGGYILWHLSQKYL